MIIAGGIDLSVGAIYALASVLGALTLHAFGPDGGHAATSPWLGVGIGAVACVGGATLCGLINGGLIVALRVHPFIITLGMMVIARGLALIFSNGAAISPLGDAFNELGQGYEYLIKKFADDAGHTAAEFYTNRTVVHLMTEMLDVRPMGSP